MSAPGTKLPIWDVSSTVAIGSKADSICSSCVLLSLTRRIRAAGRRSGPSAFAKALHRFSSRRVRGSFRFGAGDFYDLTPLLDFRHDVAAKLGGAKDHWRAAQFGNARLDARICQAGIDRLVELVDDLGRRAFRDADTEPPARFVAGDGVGNGRHVRQHLYTRPRGGRERAQGAR